MVVALVALTGLVGLGSLAVLSVQGGIASTGHDRFQAIALYAAEGGAAVAVDHLRKNIRSDTKWSGFVTPSNTPPSRPETIPGNGVLPGEPGNLFGPDLQAWYEIEIRNNPDDLNFSAAADNDRDSRITIVATGHGPNGAVAQVEVEIKSSDPAGLGRPCPSYGQKGMAEDGAGRNDCLTDIDEAIVGTARPGEMP